MESDKKGIINMYIRNLDDNSLLEFVEKAYNCGYVDGYNGNDADKEFEELLEDTYKDAIK